jgi:hypothetical protein
MPDGKAPTPETPKQSGWRRRLRIVVMGLGAAVLLCCCGPIGSVGWLYFDHVRTTQRQALADRDRLFDEAFAGGNIEDLIARADPRLRKAEQRAAQANPRRDPGVLRGESGAPAA